MSMELAKVKIEDHFSHLVLRKFKQKIGFEYERALISPDNSILALLSNENCLSIFSLGNIHEVGGAFLNGFKPTNLIWSFFLN